MSRSPSPARESRRSRSPARKSRRSRTYSRSPSPTQCKRLHIANIDDTVRRRDIEDCYGKFGKLADIWVASYPPFYAFVVYERSDDAAKALEKMRTGYVRDCKVRTSIALPRNQGGGGGGGGGSRRYGNGGGGGGRRSPYGGRSERRRSRSPRRSYRRSPGRDSRSPEARKGGRRRRSSSGSR